MLTVNEIIIDVELRSIFLSYAKQHQHVDEPRTDVMIYFWEEVAAYKKLPDAERRQKAIDIYTTYMSKKNPDKEIAFQRSTLVEVRRLGKQYPAELFSVAQQEVVNMLRQSGCFQAFRKTVEYKEALSRRMAQKKKNSRASKKSISKDIKNAMKRVARSTSRDSVKLKEHQEQNGTSSRASSGGKSEKPNNHVSNAAKTPHKRNRSSNSPRTAAGPPPPERYATKNSDVHRLFANLQIRQKYADVCVEEQLSVLDLPHLLPEEVAFLIEEEDQQARFNEWIQSMRRSHNEYVSPSKSILEKRKSWSLDKIQAMELTAKLREDSSDTTNNTRPPVPPRPSNTPRQGASAPKSPPIPPRPISKPAPPARPLRQLSQDEQDRYARIHKKLERTFSKLQDHQAGASQNVPPGNRPGSASSSASSTGGTTAPPPLGRKLKRNKSLFELEMEKKAQSDPEIAKLLEKRDRIAREVVESEGKYVEGLQQLQDLYLTPLSDRKLVDRLGIDGHHVSALFSNVGVLANFHQVMLIDMQSVGSIADVFLKNCPYLKLYTQYVSSYPNAIETMQKLSKNKKWNKWLAAQRDSAPTALDIMSYLIMPIQRIPRYELLLRELKKHTPDNDPDSMALEAAFSEVQAIARFINERKRQVENMSEVLEFQSRISDLPEKHILVAPARRLVRFGELSYKSKGYISQGLKQCILILFNDVIVLTNTSWKFKGWMDLCDCSVVTFERAETEFMLVVPDLTLQLVCTNAGEKESWVNDVETVIHETRNISKQLTRRRASVSAEDMADMNRSLSKSSDSFF